jgi:hypothetical protein
LGFGDLLKRILGSSDATPPDVQKLPASSEAALASSLSRLSVGEQGWITFTDAVRLFSTADPNYAFGEMDDEGKRRLVEFTTKSRCDPQFMPMQGRVYFTRRA